MTDKVPDHFHDKKFGHNQSRYESLQKCIKLYHCLLWYQKVKIIYIATICINGWQILDEEKHSACSARVSSTFSTQQSSYIYKNVRTYEWDEYKLYNQEACGRPRTARTAVNNIQRLWSSPAKPKASARRNNIPDICMSSLNRIIRKDLNWHPFKIKIRHIWNPTITLHVSSTISELWTPSFLSPLFWDTLYDQ